METSYDADFVFNNYRMLVPDMVKVLFGKSVMQSCLVKEIHPQNTIYVYVYDDDFLLKLSITHSNTNGMLPQHIQRSLVCTGSFTSRIWYVPRIDHDSNPTRESRDMDAPVSINQKVSIHPIYYILNI